LSQVFSPDERTRIRSELIELAKADKRISGVAITGSLAADREDRWSDVDLAFGVNDVEDIESVISYYSLHMCGAYGALYNLAIKIGAWTYQVFFLPGTLQVDLGFAPSSEFRPLANTFKLISGTAHDLKAQPSPAPSQLIGMAWLHALHARTCILRGKLWQAEYMIGVVRDNALTASCVRLGLPYAHGRGFDALPAEIREPLLGSLVGRLELSELWKALDVAVHGLVKAAYLIDEKFAAHIESEILALAGRHL
jgi:hypothetical protein